MSVQGRTYDIFSSLTADVLPKAGAPVFLQRSLNQSGTVQVSYLGLTNGTEGYKLEIQGRMTPSHGWGVLAVFDETDADHNGEAFAAIRLMPEMRAEMISVTGVGTMSNGDVTVTLQD